MEGRVSRDPLQSRLPFILQHSCIKRIAHMKATRVAQHIQVGLDRSDKLLVFSLNQNTKQTCVAQT
jgi:hypothetical protein